MQEIFGKTTITTADANNYTIHHNCLILITTGLSVYSKLFDFESLWACYLALIEKPLVVLNITGGAGIWLTQSNELTDVSVLISLQLRPGRTNIKMTSSKAT